ncbi:MAG: anhydro-N-acetylmuramic acid kinase [Planctomycetota bacterium]|jgi:1,6-anhydro-N-acetylmuramate kinase
MDAAQRRSRLVVGVMTGTSIDAIDVAAAEITGTSLGMRAALLSHLGADLGPLREDLRRAADQKAMTAERFARLALELGQRCADAIADVAGANDRIDFVAVHGQTVTHRPPFSWQLVNPSPIAARLGCPVVFDLRQADLAAGGRGAPITPLADWVLFRDPLVSRAIVNLGGYCSVTVLKKGLRDEGTEGRRGRGAGAQGRRGKGRESRSHEVTEWEASRSSSCRQPIADSRQPSSSDEGDAEADPLRDVEGFDVCACNQVLDAVARDALKARYDEGGSAAERGKPEPRAVKALHRILALQRSDKRSLGTGDEATAWVAAHRGRLSPEDLAASAAEGVAKCIGEALAGFGIDEIVIAGGGAHNRALLDGLKRFCHRPMRQSDELRVPVQAREALAIAVLGALSADGAPITLPHVTGCSSPAPVAGTWCLPAGLTSRQQ